MDKDKKTMDDIIKECFARMMVVVRVRLKGRIHNEEWYESLDMQHARSAFNLKVHQCIDWKQEPEVPEVPLLCWVRRDILVNGYAVPVGDSYYSRTSPLPYRWQADEDGDEFQVYFNNEWINAYSVDWDFTDSSANEVDK